MFLVAEYIMNALDLVLEREEIMNKLKLIAVSRSSRLNKGSEMYEIMENLQNRVFEIEDALRCIKIKM